MPLAMPKATSPLNTGPPLSPGTHDGPLTVTQVGEQVAIVDITNGARIETYVIPGERGSGVIGINGAAAHLVHPGDLVIIMSYALVTDAEARALEPKVVHVDEKNQIVKLGSDAAEPVPGSSQIRGDLVAAK